MLKVENMPVELYLGKQTESGVTTLEIDISRWRSLVPGVAVVIFAKRPGEDSAYPVATTTDGDVLKWVISGVDTALAGNGEMEIAGTLDGQKMLSSTVRTRIAETITDVTDAPPAAAEPYVNKVIEAGRNTPKIGAHGTWLVYNMDAGEYEDTGVSAVGKDGKDAVVDATLTKEGQAADAKATGEEIGQLQRGKADTSDLENYLPKNQGAVNAGQLLSVDNQGFVSVVGKMELIETIDMSGLTKIERTQEPDGTPYAFRDVVLRCKLSAGSASPNVFVNNTVVTYYPANATSDKYATSRLFVWNGSIISMTISNVNGFNLQGNCVSTPSGLFMDWSKIHTIILSGGSSGFTEGSYVEIYGVRA